MVAFVDDTQDGIYFLGDAEHQQAIAEHITTSLGQHKGKVFIVTGGSCSGKSTAIDAVADALKAEDRFVRVARPEHYLSTPPLDRIERALRAQRYGLEHQILESNSADPHEILISSEITLPREAPLLKEILTAHRQFQQDMPEDTGPLSLVLDVANLHQSILPGVQSADKQKERKEAQACLEEIAKQYPEVEILHTKYDRGNVKSALWHMADHRETRTEIEASMGWYGIDVKHPAVRALVTAIVERNPDKFELAWQRVPSAEQQR